MLYFEMVVSMITFLAMIATLILLATGRVKPKPVIPGNVHGYFI